MLRLTLTPPVPCPPQLLLLSFALLGSLCALSFTFISSAPVLALLSFVAIASFGSSFVCSNAYLPDLGKGGQTVRAARADWEDETERLQEAEREGTGGVNGVDQRPGLMLPGLEFSREVEEEGDSSRLTQEEGERLLPDLALTNTSQAAHLEKLHQTYLSTLAIYTSHISLLAIAIGYTGGQSPHLILKTLSFSYRPRR